MQSRNESRTEHEFDFDEEEVIVGLSESLYRFAIMSGVVGVALVGLGSAAIALGAYGGGLAGPSILALGLVAMIGALLFVRPRANFDQIIMTKGSDITKLMHGMQSLATALGTFRWILVVFVLIRAVSFLMARMG
jgi:hypothetical protein